MPKIRSLVVQYGTEVFSALPGLPTCQRLCPSSYNTNKIHDQRASQDSIADDEAAIIGPRVLPKSESQGQLPRACYSILSCSLARLMHCKCIHVPHGL